MKILIISDANSSHTYKWVKGLSKFDLEICLWSLSKPVDEKYSNLPNVIVRYFFNKNNGYNFLDKIKYLFALKNLKQVLKEFKPDILHAHYATSYGLLGRLTKFKPFILSVWGSDVFDFPRRNKIFQLIFESNLRSATMVLSTSHAMAEEISLYFKGKITVTPFGVDTNLFSPKNASRDPDIFVIGCVKSLRPVYGIDYLLKAFSLLVYKYPNKKIFLKIVGEGFERDNLEKLSLDLKVNHLVTFVGKVEPDLVPDYHNQMDVEVYPSRQESFGVSVIEANSCGIPVIVSNIGGLPEVVDNNVSGFVVKSGSPEEIFKGLEKLFLSPELRLSMGISGRNWVRNKFDWNTNLLQMRDIYYSFKK